MFENFIVPWTKDLNMEMPTVLNKIAVPGTKQWTFDASVYYAMKKLNATSEQVSEMLGLYNIEAVNFKKYPTKERINIFFKKVGLDNIKAMEFVNNPEQLVKEFEFANSEFDKLKVNGVPAFVVNGKYRIMFDNIKSNDEIYQIMRALAHKK